MNSDFGIILKFALFDQMLLPTWRITLITSMRLL